MEYYSPRHAQRVERIRSKKWLELSYKIGAFSLVMLAYYLIILLALSRSM